MTDLNEQIAELLGLEWKLIDEQYRLYGWVDPNGAAVTSETGPIDAKADILPAWDEDLNLMHGLVAGLTKNEYVEYIDKLEGNDELADYDGHPDYDVLRRVTEASASQKAQAWIKVKAPKEET